MLHLKGTNVLITWFGFWDNMHWRICISFVPDQFFSDSTGSVDVSTGGCFPWLEEPSSNQSVIRNEGVIF